MKIVFAVIMAFTVGLIVGTCIGREWAQGRVVSDEVNPAGVHFTTRLPPGY